MQSYKGRQVFQLSFKVFFWGVIGILGFLIVSTNPTWGKETQAPDTALELLDKGEFAAASGHFDEALKLWQGALELKPGWSLVESRIKELPARKKRFPIDQTTRQKRVQARLDFVEGVTSYNAGGYNEAADFFAKSNKAIPDDPLCAQHLELARTMRDEVKVGRLKVICPVKARVLVDGEPKGSTPLELAEIPVGSHSLKVQDHQFVVDTQIDIKPRSLTTVNIELLQE